MLALLMAAQVAAAFNMECVGRTQQIEIVGPLQAKVNSDVPFAITIRVDLESGNWCSGLCTESFPLKGLTERYIVLASTDSSAGEIIIDDETTVQRETGEYVHRIRLGSLEHLSTNYTKAVCQRAAFTGLPAKRF